MRHPLSTFALAGILLVSPVAGFASPAPAAPKASASAKSKAAIGTHSTSGIVKSLNDKTLVLTRTGRKHGEIAFTLDSSTQRDASVAVGSDVSVRYREQGTSRIATAVTPRQHASK